jgi:mono/diheme cytochrome c family protein
MTTSIRKITLAAGAWVALSLLPGAAGAQLSPVAEAGRGEYLKYCASCHGQDARGGGPVSPFLKNPAPDLTGIAAAHGGDFPTGELGLLIDGRSMTPVHGTREMPVWGADLSEDLVEGERGEELVRGRIRMILVYLEAVQR